MKKTYKNIDELFIDKFRDFEVDPPEILWDNIKKDISKSNTKSGNFGGNRIISIIISVVAIALITSYFIFDGEKNEAIITDPVSIISENSTQVKENIEQVSINNTENVKTENLLEENPIKEKETIANIETNSEPETEQTEIEIKSEKVLLTPKIKNPKPKKEELLIEKTFDEVIESEYSKSEEIQFAQSDDNDIIYNNEVVTSDSFKTAIVSQPIISVEEELVQNIIDKSDNNIEKPNLNILEVKNTDNQQQDVIDENIISRNRIKPQISLGAYFTPEVIFYPVGNDVNKNAYTFGLGLNLNYNGFVIESGLGFNFSEDKGDYIIDYEEYLGSYEDLLSITFDTSGQTVEPIFHTTTVEVYDSLNKVSISAAKNSYTYLQIPLFVGFVKNNRRISYTLKGGPIMSFMINKNIPDVVLPEDKIKIIKIDRNIPTRINTNWQFAINVGFAYKLSNHINISIEPTFRYYLRSVYNNDNNIISTKHPYSLGVRTGLIYKF